MLHTISFSGTVAASGEKTLVSKEIPFPFAIKNFKVFFDLGAECLLQIEFFLSRDNSAPTSGEPSGTNLLGTYSQVGYVVGDGGWVEIKDEIIINSTGNFVKMYANNTDSFTHYVIGLLEIEDKLD